MRRSRFTGERIIGVLNEGEAGEQIGEFCRRHGISPITYYRWRRKYGGLEVDEARRLKRIVADQAVNLQALKNLLGKSW